MSFFPNVNELHIKRKRANRVSEQMALEKFWEKRKEENQQQKQTFDNKKKKKNGKIDFQLRIEIILGKQKKILENRHRFQFEGKRILHKLQTRGSRLLQPFQNILANILFRLFFFVSYLCKWILLWKFFLISISFFNCCSSACCCCCFSVCFSISSVKP